MKDFELFFNGHNCREFNLIVSKFWYFVYSFAYNKVYVKLKSLKIKSPRN